MIKSFYSLQTSLQLLSNVSSIPLLATEFLPNSHVTVCLFRFKYWTWFVVFSLSPGQFLTHTIIWYFLMLLLWKWSKYPQAVIFNLHLRRQSCFYRLNQTTPHWNINQEGQSWDCLARAAQNQFSHFHFLVEICPRPVSHLPWERLVGLGRDWVTFSE